MRCLNIANATIPLSYLPIYSESIMTRLADIINHPYYSLMKKKGALEPEQTQYRMRYLLGDDVIPVEKYFMATSPEQALEMFAYSCRSFSNPPKLLDFGKWNRWTNEWTYEITKESAQEKFESLSKSSGDEQAKTDQPENPANVQKKKLLLKELEKYEDLYNDPYFYVRGKPNPKYGQEINRIKKVLAK